jgi:hypothetical protein
MTFSTYVSSILLTCVFFQTLEEFPLEAEKVERGYSLSEYTTGLPKIVGLGNRSPS